MARKFKVTISLSPKFGASSDTLNGHVNIGDDLWSAQLMLDRSIVEFASDLAPMDHMYPGSKVPFTVGSKRVAMLEVVCQQ